MHICYYIHNYPLWKSGGVGTFVRTIGKKMTEYGIEVSVIVADGASNDSKIIDNGVEVYRLKESKWITGKFIPNSICLHRKIKEINEKRPIDILETTEDGLAFFSGKTNYMKVIRMHGGHHYLSILFGKKVSKWKAFKEMMSLKKADYLCAVSYTVAQYTKEYVNLKRPVEVLYNPVDTMAFKREGALASRTSNSKLVFIGSIYDKKGIVELILAMHRVIEEVPEARLFIYGRDIAMRRNSLTYMQFLKGLMDDSLKTKIFFMGEIPHSEIPKVLSKGQICVLPSKIEALPIAWLEAMAVGVPLIGGDIPSGREIIESGRNGILADPNDPDDLAGKIIFLLKNPDEGAKLASQALKDIQEKFALEKIVNDNIGFYAGILNRKMVKDPNIVGAGTLTFKSIIF
ncbi:glycosyltransferase family 4 protein [Marinilabilia rubra]|uniref:Glycosyltransferase family 1 protein n=1 Tax=Marinilabilia rubra TaxID=2162893 RepID=A0A2U2B4K7_9BACT|nr:glycosyltransferase family 4 protein [Marinilabilia rubra]PWD98011.1 hypothetical protein DDZ16_17565 [Marinilabilia rubra]